MLSSCNCYQYSQTEQSTTESAPASTAAQPVVIQPTTADPTVDVPAQTGIVPEDTGRDGVEMAGLSEEGGRPMVSFTVYRGNENADGLLAREALVPQITPEAVLSALVEDGVVPDTVRVLSLTQEQGQLFIDFNEAFSQYLCSMGTSGESIAMSSVVNTFLSAYDADSVIITVCGTTLESGHAVYDAPLTFMP